MFLFIGEPCTFKLVKLYSKLCQQTNVAYGIYMVQLKQQLIVHIIMSMQYLIQQNIPIGHTNS